MQELQEVQDMLEIKSLQLAKREKDVAVRERNITEHQKKAIALIKDEYERLIKEAETRITKEY